MRTLRLSLTGTVTLALLGGLGGAVLAQDDADTAPSVSHEAALFEGTVTYGQTYLVGTNPVIEEGRLVSRGEGWEGAYDVSDPRLAGTFRSIGNQDTLVTGGAVWTIASRIDNAEGSWLGHFTGYQDPHGRGRSHHGILTGAGAYEGLTAIMFLEATARRPGPLTPTE